MANSPDPPPADERNPSYYENLFGERIRKISRPGEATGKPTVGNGGKVGAGVVVAIVLVVLRLLVGLSRTSSIPQSTSPPGPAPHWELPDVAVQHEPILPRDALPPWEVPLPDREDPGEEQLDGRDFSLPRANPEAFLLEKGDVPFLRGLCYCIDRQNRQAKDSPGKQVWHLLDADSRKLVHEAADRAALVQEVAGNGGGPLASAPRILAALNGVLRRPELYERASFRDVVLHPDLRERAELMLEHKTPRRPGDVIPLNRWLLEAAYPEQLLPQHLRHDRRQQELGKIRARTHLIKLIVGDGPIDP